MHLLYQIFSHPWNFFRTSLPALALINAFQGELADCGMGCGEDKRAKMMKVPASSVPSRRRLLESTSCAVGATLRTQIQANRVQRAARIRCIIIQKKKTVKNVFLVSIRAWLTGGRILLITVRTKRQAHKHEHQTRQDWSEWVSEEQVMTFQGARCSHNCSRVSSIGHGRASRL